MGHYDSEYERLEQEEQRLMGGEDSLKKVVLYKSRSSQKESLIQRYYQNMHDRGLVDFRIKYIEDIPFMGHDVELTIIDDYSHE